MSLGRVEPYQQGTWKFFCPCEYEDIRFGCSRIVNDSEPNFSCERPIVDAKDVKCKFRHQLAPLVAAYEKRAQEEAARQYLLTMKQRKEEAMKTLGLTEAQVNAMIGGSVSANSTKEK